MKTQTMPQYPCSIGPSKEKVFRQFKKIGTVQTPESKFMTGTFEIIKLLVIVFKKYMTSHGLPTLRQGPETPTEC